ncbi:MAG: hypothetical protein J7480_02575 [Microbacteriaceae bacterium]|nr:hypothetical protein [Microbacteriaceae bacterium]
MDPDFLTNATDWFLANMVWLIPAIVVFFVVITILSSRRQARLRRAQERRQWEATFGADLAADLARAAAEQSERVERTDDAGRPDRPE